MPEIAATLQEQSHRMFIMARLVLESRHLAETSRQRMRHLVPERQPKGDSRSPDTLGRDVKSVNVLWFRKVKVRMSTNS